jgi:hypothetical protein
MHICFLRAVLFGETTAKADTRTAGYNHVLIMYAASSRPLGINLTCGETQVRPPTAFGHGELHAEVEGDVHAESDLRQSHAVYGLL